MDHTEQLSRSVNMKLEAKPSDPARDFCQWPYEYFRPPASGALRQEAILDHTLKVFDASGRVKTLIQKIQEKIGRFNTVWGIKSNQDHIGLELYFYDYARENRKFGPSDLNSVLDGYFNEGLKINERIPFFMWSLEIDLLQPHKIDQIDIYCNGAGGIISGGECFSVSQQGYELKNLYSFFEIPRDIQLAEEALISGPRFVQPISFPSCFAPGNSKEEVYVVARKRHNDAVYLSRMPLQPTIQTLERAAFNKKILDYLKHNEHLFSHYRFDVGIDFDVTPNRSTVAISKSGLYGLL